MGTPLDVKEWRQTRYRAQLWDWGPALCRAKRWRLLFPGVGTVFWGRWCWLAVSGIADCFTECISQSDRCKRIRHVKCHRETGMTQLIGRTDVQLRRAEASTCWCWQERGGTGQGGEERSSGATVVEGGQQIRALLPADPVQAGSSLLDRPPCCSRWCHRAGHSWLPGMVWGLPLCPALSVHMGT